MKVLSFFQFFRTLCRFFQQSCVWCCRCVDALCVQHGELFGDVKDVAFTRQGYFAMLGTLFKVWPWQLDGHNVMPWSHPDPQWLMSAAMMIAAAVLVIGLFILLAKKFSSKH